MVKIFGKPILEHILIQCINSGIKDFVFVLGYLSHIISDYFQNGEKWGVNISYTIEDYPLGNAGSLVNITHKMKQKYLLIIYGDIYFNFSLKNMIEWHFDKMPEATLGIKCSDRPLTEQLVILQNERIIGIEKRPPIDRATLNRTVFPVFIVSTLLFYGFKKNTQWDFMNDIFPLALSNQQTLMGYFTNHHVYDLGTPERIAELKRFLKDKK